jgi:protein-arginine kinase activator protein McsA
MTKDLNNKLDDLIKNEKYEDAARVRDYMIRNNIKRN